MRILNNMDSSHFNEIKDLLKDADELHIVSPFLMESFDVFFDEAISPSRIKHVTLITTLKDNDPDLFKKANSLYSFSLNCLTHKITFRIHIDNKLHGKIYIVSKDSKPMRGIITSANFTEAGLNQNHEWGVHITDSLQLMKVIADISSVSSHALSQEEVHNIIVKIDSFSNNAGMLKYPKIHLVVNNYIKHKIPKSKSDVRYFIKPVGWSDKPFSTSRILSSDIETLHFAKRPNPVRVGDMLICYGVGTTKLLGYFKAISEPTHMDEESRWPWAVKAKNLYPRYSESWTSFENIISSIQVSFNPDLPVTYVGGRTLGALQYGADKIRLSEEFANHVINIIESSV